MLYAVYEPEDGAGSSPFDDRQWIVHRAPRRKKFGVVRWLEYPDGRRKYNLVSWHRTERAQSDAIRAIDGRPFADPGGPVWHAGPYSKS